MVREATTAGLFGTHKSYQVQERYATSYLLRYSLFSLLVEAKGLEPSNLLTASQALYQLSYAPGMRRPRYQAAQRGPLGEPADLAVSVVRGTSRHCLASGDGTGLRRDVAVEREVAASLARRGHLRGRERRPAARPSTRCACTPTPPGPAHQGHVRNYTFGDLVVRFRTMHGYAVLSPIGFDSFGLPGRERGDPHRDPPPGLHRGPHGRAQGVAHPPGRRLRLAARDSRATTPSTSAGTR